MAGTSSSPTSRIGEVRLFKGTDGDTYVHLHACVHEYMCNRMHTYMYTHVYTCAHLHTHTYVRNDYVSAEFARLCQQWGAFEWDWLNSFRADMALYKVIHMLCA